MTNPNAQRSPWRDYVALARPDHWFKNAFMLLGVVLAYFYQLHAPDRWTLSVGRVVVALAAVCLIASSNYVINELLDAPYDRLHPEKRTRPLAQGRLQRRLVLLEWLALGAIGLTTAWFLNPAFFTAALAFWAMGIVYNVPPVRAKDWPYADVLTESANNPLRLLLGWFVVSSTTIPPMSLLVSYWMAGAFFMAGKRLAEIRSIGDARRAGSYRPAFRFYDDTSLLIHMFFYATASALLLGVFIVRYHIELILSVPLIAGLFALYLHITLKPGSAAQRPEYLYRERRLMFYLAACLLVFTALMFLQIDLLRTLFNVEEASVPPLWRL